MVTKVCLKKTGCGNGGRSAASELYVRSSGATGTDLLLLKPVCKAQEQSILCQEPLVLKWASGCYKNLAFTCLFSSEVSCHQSLQIVNIVVKTQGRNQSLREKLSWPEGDGFELPADCVFAQLCAQHRAKNPNWAVPFPVYIHKTLC